MKESTFDNLVGDFYRAATGAIAWQVPLAGVQAAFGASFALLHTLDLADGRMLSLESGRVDMAEAELNYLRDYHRLDPRRTRTMQLGPAGLGVWHHDHEHFDPEFVAADRFYRDYLPAYDSRYAAHVVVPVAGTVATGFALELPAARGPLDADEREYVRRLGVHVKGALLAQQQVRRLATQALAGHALLTAFPYPMWLIDTSRHVAFANAAAIAEAEQATRVVQRQAGLALIDPAADRRLTERLHALVREGHGASATVDLQVSKDAEPTWLHLSALAPGEVFGVFGDRPQVLATLLDPTRIGPVDAFALVNLFGLTPTEADVAARLADGLTAGQIGAAHGTHESTVRTQIGRVLQKLGAGRSVDVVRMLRQGEALWVQAGRTPSC